MNNIKDKFMKSIKDIINVRSYDSKRTTSKTASRKPLRPSPRTKIGQIII